MEGATRPRVGTGARSRPILVQRHWWFRNPVYDKPLLARALMWWVGGFHGRTTARSTTIRGCFSSTCTAPTTTDASRAPQRVVRTWVPEQVTSGWGYQDRIVNSEECAHWIATQCRRLRSRASAHPTQVAKCLLRRLDQAHPILSSCAVSALASPAFRSRNIEVIPTRPCRTISFYVVLPDIGGGAASSSAQGTLGACCGSSKGGRQSAGPRCSTIQSGPG